MLRTVGRLILKLMAIVCIIGIVALLGILDVFLLLGYALHGLILACAGYMVLMMILVTQDWQSLLDHDTGEKETRNRYKIFVAIFCLFSLNTLFRF